MPRHLAALSIAIGALSAQISAAQAPSETGDPYEFKAAGSVPQSVRLSRSADGVRFTWPHTAAAWDTALLAVRSSATERDPYVEVSVGELRIQQYLDAQ